MQEGTTPDLEQLNNQEGYEDDETQPLQPPPPVVIEIGTHQYLESLLSNILNPVENGPDFQQIMDLLNSSAKIQLSKIPVWNFSPHVRPEIFNAAGDKTNELLGPLRHSLHCSCTSGPSIPITYNGEKVVSFTYVVGDSACYCGGDQKNAVEVYLPTRGEPIGRIEYTTRDLIKDEVTIKNYFTQEILTGRPIRVGELPGMEVKNQPGNVVANVRVTSAVTDRGFDILFPSVGISTTTKCLLMILGTMMQIDDHQTRDLKWRRVIMVCSIPLVLISLIWLVGDIRHILNGG